MSSKKQLRRERRARERARKSEARRKLTPVQVFGIFLAAVVLAGLAAWLLGDAASTQGDPPRPGMVWSPEHGHWH